MNGDEFEIHETLEAPIGSLALRDPIIVPAGEPLLVRDARAMMRAANNCCIIGVDPETGRIRSIFTDRDYVTRLDLGQAHGDNHVVGNAVTLDVKTIAPNDPVGYALWLMSTYSIRRLPVVDDDGRVLKFVSVRDIFRYLANVMASWQKFPQIAQAVVDEFITKDPIAVRADYPVTIVDAAKLMAKNKVGCVLVTGGADGRLAGIASERDIALMDESLDPSRTGITEIMTRQVEVVHLADRAEVAIKMMAEGGYRHLPVVDREKHRPVGVVSVRDIIDLFAQIDIWR